MKTGLNKLEQKIFPILRKKQVEIAYIPPQSLGSFTPFYHRAMPFLKVSPWRVIFLWSLFATVMLRLVLGHWFVRLASLLQRGF